METLENWKLNISSFYPIGLTHYGNNKEALVIAWSCNFLCTKKFRTFSNAIQNNLPADKEHLTNIRQIATNSSISQIVTGVIVGTRETVILTENGQLLYFEKVKVLRKVNYVEKIKCISASKQGFLIIFLNNNDSNIMIMIHPDSFPCPSKSLRSFNVSFENNFCQTTWKDAHFKIVSLHANPDKPNFFNVLRKCPGEQYAVEASFIFFSINNAFLALIVDGDDDYRYHQIQTHSSNIRGIYPSKDLSAIYLLLESGVVDVIYSCEILGVIRTTSLFFVYDVGPYDMCEDMFVFSDGLHVVVGRIQYCSETKTFKNHHKVIDLPGIVALTIVKVVKTILCLSENRKFYKISYSDDDLNDNKSPDANNFIPVKEFLVKAQRETIDIAELVAHYDNVKDETLLENKKFEAIALRYNYKNGKSIFRVPFNAKLKVYRTLPDLPLTTIYPTAMHFDKNNYFLHIQIQPHRFGQVFTSNIWSLSIHYGSHHCDLTKVIRLFNENFEKPLDVVVILKIQNEIAPPKVNINLCTSVNIGQDCLCLTFPIQTDVIDFKDLIKVSNSISSCQNMSSNHRNASQHISKSSESPKELTCHLHLPKAIPFNDLIQLIDSRSPVINGNSCYLNLLSSNLELNLDPVSNQLRLKSSDAGIMFHVKKMFVEHLRTTFKLTVERQPNAISRTYDNAMTGIEDCFTNPEKIKNVSKYLNDVRIVRFNEF